MANRNWASGGKIYSMHVKPVLLDCNFVVDSTNANGLGISSLKGPCIQNVFMNTTATAAALAAGNPNPAAGYIVVQLADNYNRVFSVECSLASPLSGSSLLVASAGLTVGLPYVITILGTTTAAQWVVLGVPVGVTPAVGVAFVAAATSCTGTGAVQVPAAAGSGVFSIETVGNPNLSIAPSPSSNQGFGGQFILRCLKDSASDAPVIGTPADNTVISLQIYLSDSSILIQGE